MHKHWWDQVQKTKILYVRWQHILKWLKNHIGLLLCVVSLVQMWLGRSTQEEWNETWWTWSHNGKSEERLKKGQSARWSIYSSITSKKVFYVQDPLGNYWYVVLTFPPKGLRNSNTYDLDYAYLSIGVDFQGTKCKDDEAIGDGEVDYVRQDYEGMWLDVDN